MTTVPTATLDARLLRFRAAMETGRVPLSSHEVALLAEELLTDQRHRDALDVVCASLGSKPDDAALLSLKARAHFAARELLPAQAALLEAARLAPGDAEVFRWLGEVMMKRGQPERALHALSRASLLRPHHPATERLLERARRLAHVARSTLELGHEEPRAALPVSALGPVASAEPSNVYTGLPFEASAVERDAVVVLAPSRRRRWLPMILAGTVVCAGGIGAWHFLWRALGDGDSTRVRVPSGEVLAAPEPSAVPEPGHAPRRAPGTAAEPSPQAHAQTEQGAGADTSSTADRRDDAWSAAELALGRGHIAEALAIMEPLLREGLLTARQWSLWGDASLAIGEVGRAVAAYGKALEIDPDSLEAAIGRGEVELRSERPQQAVDHLDAAQQMQEARTYSPALVARLRVAQGRAYLMRRVPGDLDQARQVLQAATGLPGAPHEAFFWLGEALSGRFSRRAAEAYKRYLTLAPDGPYAARARRATLPRP